MASNQFPNRPNQAAEFQLDQVNPVLHPSSAIDSGLDQQDYYGVLALNGVVGSNADYQLAYTAHYNTQTFSPDPIGDLIYQGIASNVFTSDLSNTLAGDLTYRLGALHTLRGGFYFGEYGVESDQRSQVFPIVMGDAGYHPDFRDRQPEQDQPGLWSISSGYLADYRPAESWMSAHAGTV